MKLVLFVGPTGSGKSSFIDLFVKYYGFNYIVSTTTREMRDSEFEGSPYNFISRDEFIDKINSGSFVEYENIHGNLYGVENKSINLSEDKIYLKDIGVEGALNLKKLYGDDVVILYIDVEDDDIEKRLISRGDKKEDILKRLERVEYERSFINICDYYILNKDLDKSFKELENFLFRK